MQDLTLAHLTLGTPPAESIAAARAALGDDRFAAAWAEGRAMALEQAVAYALEEGGN